LFKGIPENEVESLKDSVLIDFGSLFAELKDKVKYYVDLSERGDYVEAVN
jgi:hypothetical protein